jgi:hypothetical protein
MNLDDLVGKRWAFYGVDNNTFRIREIGTRNTITLEVVEDKEDGYRSSLDKLRTIDSPAELKKLIFFKRPVVTLTGRSAENDANIVELYSGTDFVWLRIGTDESDSYYPTFVFSYNTPEDASIEALVR